MQGNSKVVWVRVGDLMQAQLFELLIGKIQESRQVSDLIRHISDLVLAVGALSGDLWR